MNETHILKAQGKGRARFALIVFACLMLVSQVAVAANEGGIAATAHPIATQAALSMMEMGGNAVDAAVAAAFTIGVVEPDGSGLGGGGGMLIYLHGQQKTLYINYYHQAPGDPDAISFDPETERNTAKSVLVPGTAAGLCYALETYGTLPLETVIQPAIDAAEAGFPIDATLAGILLDNLESLMADPDLASIFLPSGFPLMEGEILVQPELAATLTNIRDNGRDGFYKGEVAQALVEGLTARGGVMALEDLANYEVTETEAVHGSYRGYRVISAQAPHAGATLIETLNMLEFIDFPEEHFAKSADAMHRMAEVFRRTYADRSQYVGDPRFHSVPVDGLVSKGYAKERFDTINLYKSEPRNYRDTTYGNPLKYVGAPDPVPVQQEKNGSAIEWDDEEDDNPRLKNRFQSDPFNRWRKDKKDNFGRRVVLTDSTAQDSIIWDDDDGFDGGHTTHLAVIDTDSNMVSLTQTLGNFFGSKVIIAGVILNNGRNNFSLISQSNMIEPNKRPRSSICPTLLFKGSTPYAAIGSPGAGRIIASIAEVVVNLVDYDMNAVDANDAPRFFCQKYEDHFFVESRIEKSVQKKLERKGHPVRELGAYDLFFGGIQMTLIKPNGEGFDGSADPRRGGNAMGLGTGEDDN